MSLVFSVRNELSDLVVIRKKLTDFIAVTKNVVVRIKVGVIIENG